MSKVLVVDDNAANLELARELLEMEGHEVLTAWNGREALDCAASEMPDLILMDLRMPVMNGHEAMRQIKADARTRAIPVVALTASAMKGQIQKILGEGFDGYIDKPIEVASFAGKVAAFLPGGD